MVAVGDVEERPDEALQRTERISSESDLKFPLS